MDVPSKVSNAGCLPVSIQGRGTVPPSYKAGFFWRQSASCCTLVAKVPTAYEK